MDELESELRQLIVEALELEDVTAESIDVEAPLFSKGAGLSLDSIDALELSIALSERYGITLQAEKESSRKALFSVRSLAQYISVNR